MVLQFGHVVVSLNFSLRGVDLAFCMTFLSESAIFSGFSCIVSVFGCFSLSSIEGFSTILVIGVFSSVCLFACALD